MANRGTVKLKLLESKIAKNIGLLYKTKPYIDKSSLLSLYHIDNETTTLLSLFEICSQMHFISLFFRNEGNIATSFLTFKCTVVHYAKLGSLEYAISLFSISYLYLF